MYYENGYTNWIQFIPLGMNKFLKYSDLQETVLNELTRRLELLIDGSKS